MAEIKGNVIEMWLSAGALIVRSCFYKILAVLLLMALTEGILFYRALYGEWRHPSLEQMISASFASAVFVTALAMVFFILVFMEGMLNDRSRYTLMRLRITQTQFFVVKAVINVLLLTLLFAAQIGIVFGMAWLYAKEAEYEGRQLLFLAFNRNAFLHCLLPMAETGKWVRNILLVMAFGMEAAGCVGKKSYAIAVIVGILGVSCFVSSIGVNYLDILCDIAFGISIAASCVDKIIKPSRRRNKTVIT